MLQRRSPPTPLVRTPKPREWDGETSDPLARPSRRPPEAEKRNCRACRRAAASSHRRAGETRRQVGQRCDAHRLVAPRSAASPTPPSASRRPVDWSTAVQQALVSTRTSTTPTVRRLHRATLPYFSNHPACLLAYASRSCSFFSHASSCRPHVDCSPAATILASTRFAGLCRRQQ